MFGKIFKEFMQNTSIHGLKFLVDDKIHWSERLFWVICLIFSWYGSSLLIMASWTAFINNPISFVVETTYTDWNTDFPSIAVCETENSEKIEQASDSLWSKNHDFNLEEVLKELAFFKGVSYYLLQFCATPDADVNCPQRNFTHYANMVRSSCDEIFSNCTWSDELFDCCEYFLPIETELGMCFAINSIQGKDPNGKKLIMDNNKITGPGTINMNIHVPSNIYIIGEEEVPALTSLTSDILVVAGQIHYKRHIALRSIENDLAAREVSAGQRRCKYPDEDPASVYRYHSYTACTVQCRKDAQLKICNCTSFFMPNTSHSLHCGLDGLTCLHEHYGELSVLRAAWGSRSGLYCNCQPSCTETDISVIADDRTATLYSHSHVEISLDFLPTERFRRNVVRGPLDLVVSMGGTAGLFLGASILSFVELPYFFIVRGFRTFLSKRQHSTTDKSASRSIVKSAKKIPTANYFKTKKTSVSIEKAKQKRQPLNIQNRTVLIKPADDNYRRRLHNSYTSRIQFQN